MDAATYIKNVKCQSDCYEQTIQILICFDAAIRFDAKAHAYIGGSHFLPGRRLLKDPKDKTKYVTPDAVSQLSDTYGVIGEVKFSASSDHDFANAHEQLQKYDGNLYGWITNDKTIKLHDLSLLVNDLHRNRAKEFFKGKTFDRQFTLIACAHQKQVHEVVKIEKFEGRFSDKTLEMKMAHPIPVPIEKLIGQISNVKFYDAEPPVVEYTMSVLWMSVFNELASKKDATKASTPITVSLAETVKMLKDRFAFPKVDGLQPDSPRTEWVRKALNALVRIGWVKRKSKTLFEINYVHYSQHKSMLEVFAKKVFEADSKKKAADPKQLLMKPVLNVGTS